MNKEQKLRIEGARWAIEMAKDKGVEQAETELARRGAWNIPFSILDKSHIRQFTEEFKRQLCAITLLTLADEFDFNKEQMVRFEKRFNLKTDCVGEDVTFTDYAQILREEYGVDVDRIEEW